MDYRKLMYYLFANFVLVSSFILAALFIILSYKRKSENSENINLQDIKSDQIKVIPNKLSDIGSAIGVMITMVFFFWYATLPVLYDIPYLISQNYMEYEGTIVQNNGKGITVEVVFENDESEKVEISGSYNFPEGEKIILEYLPHMRMRMYWYVSNTDSSE